MKLKTEGWTLCGSGYTRENKVQKVTHVHLPAPSGLDLLRVGISVRIVKAGRDGQILHEVSNLPWGAVDIDLDLDLGPYEVFRLETNAPGVAFCEWTTDVSFGDVLAEALATPDPPAEWAEPPTYTLGGDYREVEVSHPVVIPSFTRREKVRRKAPAPAPAPPPAPKPSRKIRLK